MSLPTSSKKSLSETSESLLANYRPLPRGGGSYCAARSCNHSSRAARYGSHPNVSFHTFPRDGKRCQEWLRRVGRDDLLQKSDVHLYRHHRLCSKHFSDDMFMNVSSKKKRLIWNAVPTRNLCSGYITERQDTTQLLLEDLDPEASSSQQSPERRITDTSLDEDDPVPHKKSKLSSVQNLSHYSFDESNISSECGFDYKQVNILKSLSDLNEKSKGGWTEQVKELSFILYHHCPRDYDFLSCFFSLPPLSVLQDWVGSLCLGNGLQKEVFIAIQHKLCMLKNRERICSLSFLELPLTQDLFYCSKGDYIGGLVDFGNFGSSQNAANSALVLIVSGIHKQWTQPFGYFLKERKKWRLLKNIIFECLTKLSEIDLDVKVFICYPSKVNKSLLQDLGVSELRPYFTHNNSKIFCMFDPFSLKATTGTTLKNHDIYFGKKVSKWDHIKEYYSVNSVMMERFSLQRERDSAASVPEKNLVSLYLDKEVIAGVYALGLLGHCKGAKETGEFLDKMHCLYSFFDNHSGTHPHETNEGECANDIEYLSRTLEWIQCWKIDGVGSVNCQDGWCITLSCLLHLFEELKDQFFSCKIIAKHLNQTSSRHRDLYWKTKEHAEEIVPSNAEKFYSVYKTYLKRSLFQSVKWEVRNNLVHFFSGYEEFMKMCKGMSKESMYSYHHLEGCKKLDLPKVNTLAFIAVNIIMKLRSVVFCKRCLGELIQEKVIYETKNQGLELRDTKNKVRRRKANRTMIAPHKKLLKIMPKLESSFLFALKNMFHMPRVKMKIHQFMYKDICNDFADFDMDCEDVKKMLIGLFINISLEQVLSLLSVSEGKIVIPEHL